MSAFPIPSYSHSGEDRLIWKLFGYRPTGTYVDIGCYHPMDYSNTYLLYRAGWRGTVVDADDHFLPLYREARPGDRVVNAAISNSPGIVTLYTLADRSLNTIDDTVARNHEAAKPGSVIGQKTVEARRLGELLGEVGAGNVDFLNIDVEGRDLDVLESNDWQRWSPGMIAIEDHAIKLAAVADSPTFRFMAMQGYFLHSKCNYTCIYLRTLKG